VLALALAGAEQVTRAADIAAALSIDALRAQAQPVAATLSQLDGLKASRTIDVEKRKRLYNEVQKILWEEGPELIPYFRNYVSAIRKTVKNYKLIPLQWVELRDVWLDR